MDTYAPTPAEDYSSKISGRIGGSAAAAKMPDLAIAFDAMDSASQLCSRVQVLADRICGCQPQEATQTGTPPQPDGVAPRMADTARSLNHAIRRANEAIERIENVLP